MIWLKHVVFNHMLTGTENVLYTEYEHQPFFKSPFFKSFITSPSRAVKGSTVEKPEVVNNFLRVMAEKLRPHSEKDLAVMRSMKKAEVGSSCVSIGQQDTIICSSLSC